MSPNSPTTVLTAIERCRKRSDRLLEQLPHARGDAVEDEAAPVFHIDDEQLAVDLLTEHLRRTADERPIGR